jgi:hypothetical protein
MAMAVADEIGESRDGQTLYRPPGSQGVLAGVLRLVAQSAPVAAQALGALLGWFMLHVPNKQRRNALINIRLCLPELDEAAALDFRRRALLGVREDLL